MKNLTCILLLSGFLSANVQAQNADSLRTVTLDPVVVIAERVESALSTSTVGVSVLNARQLASIPTRSFSDALNYLPGLTFLDVDGMGFSPQAVTRGFYGGGEAEYVVVLINGRPINTIENGLVNWDQMLANASTSVEVLRGGASSLYGDAAIGAVINVRTAPVETINRQLSGSIGSSGLLNGQMSIQTKKYTAAASYRAVDGYRDHSTRSSWTAQGEGEGLNTSRATVRASAAVNIREYETPGPLRSSDGSQDRSYSLPFFQFDTGSEETVRLSVEADINTVLGVIEVSTSSEYRNHDFVRTLPLSADFADTQERQVDALGTRATMRLADLQLPLPIAHKLVIGADAFSAGLDSRYLQIATGGIEDAYASATGENRPELSDGSASRDGLAGYLHLDLYPTSKLKVSVGGRVDRIEDTFDEVEGLSEAREGASHVAVSPKLGVNYRYVSSSSQVGNVYVSSSRSFKAPTLDQLYDLRAFPVPFPPYSIQIANAGLNPQYGINYEVGFYHRLSTAQGLSAMLSASAYRLDMKDEIDFSFDTFSNINIGESRHQGLEVGLNMADEDLGSVFLNYTLQDVTYLIGENKGNAVKAIPLHSFSGGLQKEVGPWMASLTLRGNRKMYIDDANTSLMDDYAVVDARISYAKDAYRLTFDAFNLLDKSYSTTAYQDPGGSETTFLFPASLRTISVGFQLSW
ncbi:MAG TPA: hypothetical protein DCY57_06315 [Bacteroidetes bacterium]|nr:hypothetical protein [Bacteroidota bacterium]